MRNSPISIEHLSKWADSPVATGLTNAEPEHRGFSHERTRVVSDRPTPYKNFTEILLNQDAWFTAYELSFGRIRVGDPSPEGLRATRQALDQVWAIVLGGASVVGDWCLDRRQKATGNTRHVTEPFKCSTYSAARRERARRTFGRGVQPSALFLASGVERAWGRTASVHEKGTAIVEAYARITKPREPVRPAVMGRLLDFVDRICERTSGRDMQLPGAAFKSCFGHATRDGGQVGAVHEWETADGRRPLNTWKAAKMLIARKRLVLLSGVARACIRLDRLVKPSFKIPTSQNLRTTSSALLTRVLMVEATSDLSSEEWTAVWNGGDIWSDNRNLWDDDIGDIQSEEWLYDGQTGLYYDPMSVFEPTPHPGMPNLSKSIRLLSELGFATHPSVSEVDDSDPGAEWLPPLQAYVRLRSYLYEQLARICDARPGETIRNNLLLDPELVHTAPLLVDLSVLKFSPLAIAHEACRRTARHTDENPSKVILKNFQNPVGKGRLATIHEPHVVLAAKAVTSWLTPRLKHVRTNKDILRNQTVILNPSGSNPAAYSADWKKGTDEISNETASAVLIRALKSTGAPDWMIRAVPGIVGHMVVYADPVETDEGDKFPLNTFYDDAGQPARCEGKRLTCGASMGLGPSWFIMSLMNDFAASEAGADPGTFSVNGDDLIGYWSSKRVKRYEACLRSIHIVPNVKKSFHGPYGVFCERFVHKHPDRDALVARPVYRIGEASGVRSLDGERGFSVVDTLVDISRGRTPNGYQRTHRLVRSLAGRTASRGAFRTGRRSTPGRIEHGGCGAGTANGTTLINYLMHGSTNVSTHRSTVLSRIASQKRSSDLMRLIDESKGVDVEDGVRIKEVAAEWSTRDNQSLDVLQKDWMTRLRLKTNTSRDLAKQHNKNVEAARRICQTPLEVLLSPTPPDGSALWRWSTRTRQRAAHFVRAKKYDRAISYLSSHTIKVAAPDRDSLYPPHLQRIAGRKYPTGACLFRT